MSYMDQYASLEVPAVPVPEHIQPSSAVVASSVAVAKTGTPTQQDGQASQLLVSSSLRFPSEYPQCWNVNAQQNLLSQCLSMRSPAEQ